MMRGNFLNLCHNMSLCPPKNHALVARLSPHVARSSLGERLDLGMQWVGREVVYK